MYYDTIKCENKIISSEALMEIFQTMNDTLKKYERISEQEKMQNQMLERKYQKFTYDYTISKLSFQINFTDNTNISIDKFETFSGIFYSRISEIKNIYVRMSSLYDTKEEEQQAKSYRQYITLDISNKKMNISVELDSDDPKFDNVYNKIKEKVLMAPEKYDDVMRNKSKIVNAVTVATGMIPAIIITSIFLFIPTLNKVFLKGIVVYPLVVVFLMYMIGSIIANSKLDKYYDTISPDKKYAGYDTTNHKSIYKDDMDSYLNTSDILIGSKVNNLVYREKIREIYNKYKNSVLPMILVLAGVSVVVAIVGLLIEL